ncbi:MAG: pyridoxamine 5'-phosphate oxidase family protein [Alistipes sp.]|jgi:uncharacterized protein YhbP (UPF0306 family)|nr:pyridoxamine 5'-phosphate oxidase family protein [Alistipes sp.]
MGFAKKEVEGGGVSAASDDNLAKIAAFIRKHHVMTLATVGSDGQPWCAHAFYAWMAEGKRADGKVRAEDSDGKVRTGAEQGGCLVFMNNPATRHGTEMLERTHVAAAIALETRVVGRLQGLQIEGEVRMATGAELEAARRTYLRRFPYATVMEQPLWILVPTLMKLTDNTLGFGKKLVWTKS